MNSSTEHPGKALDGAAALSVLIPNFNYARYIGSTIDSVLMQGQSNVEILVCDNASTDRSVDVVRQYCGSRVRLSVNPCNVGFSANVERVASLATGRRMLLLSSDDRMKEGAVAAYDRLEAALGPASEWTVWGSATDVIDADGSIIGRIEADEKLWRDAEVDPRLSELVDLQVRCMPASVMLKRSLELLRTPLPFATTCYSKALHDAVGGYAGSQLINPDKWFLWKLLSVADTVCVIDHALFEYRIHGAGQGPQEQRSGALKHLTDEYVATINLPESVLAKAGLDRQGLARAFVEHDIALRGLVAVAEARRNTARRRIHFGTAAYPDLMRSNPKIWLLRALLTLGPLGTKLAGIARSRAEERWRARESRS